MSGNAQRLEQAITFYLREILPKKYKTAEEAERPRLLAPALRDALESHDDVFAATGGDGVPVLAILDRGAVTLVTVKLGENPGGWEDSVTQVHLGPLPDARLVTDKPIEGERFAAIQLEHARLPGGHLDFAPGQPYAERVNDLLRAIRAVVQLGCLS